MMLRSNLHCVGWIGVTMLALSGSVGAQVSPSPVPDLTPQGGRAPPPTPANLPPPNADPRDLNGVYSADRVGGPGAAPSAGPARAPGAPPAPPPPRPRSNDIFVECTPSISPGTAGSPGMIVQTPGRLTFIGEGNNNVRRIYVGGKFPEKLTPSRLGYSVGRWQGDTLVIETRGIKTNGLDPTMSSITSLIERLRKTDGGHTIESVSTIEGVGSDGKTVTVTRNGRMVWRPDMVPIQVTCEEGQDYSFE